MNLLIIAGAPRLLEYEGIAHVLVAVAGGILMSIYFQKKLLLWRYEVMHSRRKVPESFEPDEVVHRRLIRFLLRLKIIDPCKHIGIIKDTNHDL